MSTYFHLKFIVKMAVLKKKTEKVFVKRFGESKILFKHSKQEGKKSWKDFASCKRKLGKVNVCFWIEESIWLQMTQDTVSQLIFKGKLSLYIHLQMDQHILQRRTVYSEGAAGQKLHEKSTGLDEIRTRLLKWLAELKNHSQFTKGCIPSRHGLRKQKSTSKSKGMDRNEPGMKIPSLPFTKYHKRWVQNMMRCTCS